MVKDVSDATPYIMYMLLYNGQKQEICLLTIWLRWKNDVIFYIIYSFYSYSHACIIMYAVVFIAGI